MSTSLPAPTTEVGEKQQQLPPYITRYIPQWTTPTWLLADAWRRVVRQQPIAIDCRDFIISFTSALPWRVIAKDAAEADKHKTEIDYYTNLFETQDGGYVTHTELLMQDMLDLPFGGASEVGRENDSPDGRVLWIKHIDGGTLFPTFSSDWPVGQRIKELSEQPVYFPEYAIARAYYTPRPEILRKGWGMAPPEKIYLAIQLLYRGDAYYANLLIDTPEAGILDLGDMSAVAAKEWLTSWQDLMHGTDPFKVPVLYEHTTTSKYIPFGRSPVELAYENTTLRYAQFVASNYGVTLADIGVFEGDTATLAGTIRGERRTNRSGLATARQKVTYYRNQMLPEFLRFELIVQDDELLVAKGRARLANSLAMKNLVDARIITKQDAQEQLVADGLVTVPLEDIEDPQPLLEGDDPSQRLGGFLRPPVPASEGGEGEVTARALVEPLLTKGTLIEFQRLSRIVERKVGDLAITAKNSLKAQDLLQWRTNLNKPAAMGIAGVVVDVEQSVFDTLHTELKTNLWWQLNSKESFVDAYEKTIKAVGQAIIDRQYVEGEGVPAIVNKDIALTHPATLKELADFVSTSIGKANAQIMQMLSREVVLATLTELSREQPGNAATIARAVFYEKLEPIVQALATEITMWMRESVISQMVPDGVIPEELWNGGKEHAGN